MKRRQHASSRPGTGATLASWLHPVLVTRDGPGPFRERLVQLEGIAHPVRLLEARRA
jgi:hypothetical protein